MLDSELLHTCGLNKTEQEILIHLLQNGASTGGMIAKRLNHKRTTTYSALGSLTQHGLVVREEGKRGGTFEAIEPTLIPDVLRTRAEATYQEIAHASDLISQQLINFQQTRTRGQVGSYKILATESKEAAYTLIYDIVTRSGFCSIFDINTVTQEPAAKSLIERFLVDSAKTKYPIRDIAIDGKNMPWYLEQIQNPNHQVKVVPKDYRILTDFILSEGVVFQTSYEPNQEMVIQIIHQAYYRSMMTTFDLIWDHLPKSYTRR